MEGEEVVADELVNDALHKRFKMILTERSLLSVLMQMERLLRNIANMFGSSYRVEIILMIVLFNQGLVLEVLYHLDFWLVINGNL